MNAKTKIFREKLLECLGGPWPEGGDLKPKIQKTEQKDGYRLIWLSYELEPNDRCPAILLVPDGVSDKSPAPAVAIWHQHAGQWHLGKTEPAGLAGNPMHHTGAALAKLGYVVLCPDALCFEERQDPLKKLRGSAFERRIAEAGFSCTNVQFEPDRFPWEGRWVNMHEHIAAELRRLPKPVGIFAKDDMLGSNIIRNCNELDIAVPGEVAVIGTNADEVFCQICTPPLSSVAYPGERVGYQAASLLSTMMRGARVTDDHVMPIPIHELVARESTNTLAVDDPVVAEAVHFIRSRAPSYPVHVSEVVERSRLSHSGFNKNFLKQMGHTPKEEIKRVRLARLQALLKNTGKKISQVAREMRFESPEELTRFFKRETGFAPKDYRKHYHPASNRRGDAGEALGQAQGLLGRQ